jgi:DNA-binding transcriptional MocR family regulator
MLPADGPPPLWTFLPEQTHYITSLTKCLVSGLRTGYLVAPGRATPGLVRRIRASSWMATPLVAEIASRWIAAGVADELVGWQRRELAERHRIADRLLAGLDYHHHPHSLHLWLDLPERWRGEAFVSEARLRNNVAITPAEPFAVGGARAPHSVRLSLSAAATRDQLQRGLRTLADILQIESEPFYMPT